MSKKLFSLLLVSFFTVAVINGCSVTPDNMSEVNEEKYYMQNEVPYPTDYMETGRRIISLDGEWKFRIDPGGKGEVDRWFETGAEGDGWRDIRVPGSWDTAFGREFYNYKGDAWYARTFDAGELAEGGFMRLVFQGSFLNTTVWLNGREIGVGRSGYTPFTFDVSGDLKEGANLIVVRVNNRLTYGTMPIDTRHKSQKHGWWPYGGIHRSVYIEVSDIPLTVFRADIRPETTDDLKGGILKGVVGIYNSSDEDIKGAGITVVASAPDGTRVASFRKSGISIAAKQVKQFAFQEEMESVALWDTVSPENIYKLDVELDYKGGSDRVAYEFGFRKFEIRGNEIFLNGRKHYLYGINRHEDDPETGLYQTDERLAQDLELLKELNCNHIRPGHYPNDTRFIRMLERAGLTIVEEVPSYQLGGIDMGRPEVLELIMNQLVEMIERDRNHPAIIGWSLSNELIIYANEAKNYVESLNAASKEWDPGRFTTIEVAVVGFTVQSDYASDIVDIVSLNEYFGWYYGDSRGLKKYLKSSKKIFGSKPVIISEFGAGTLQGRHVDKLDLPEPNDDHSYSEEYQADLYSEHFRAIFRQDYIVGTMPWVFADFRMEWVQTTGKPHPVPEMNLKGLLSHDRKKKAAFETVSNYYRLHQEKYGYR
ncbi:MAG TPA: glycoside hydrolase family 2 TIM barrel-domain containing protein [bacterium]|nr:glycoside hydrolase family 2 TIM barrel-domain containing protein [bacterium]